jgi:hypothetical protein
MLKFVFLAIIRQKMLNAKECKMYATKVIYMINYKHFKKIMYANLHAFVCIINTKTQVN